jgi:hypothetical protein
VTTPAAIDRAEIEAALADAERTVARLRALLADLADNHDDRDGGTVGSGGGAYPTVPTDLVPAAVAARRLSVTAAAVRAWFARGEIRGNKHGTAIVVSMSDARDRRARMRRQPEK